MRYNGLCVVIDMAAREVDHPLIDRHRATLILGSLREDVWYVPGIRLIYEHLSFSHFYGPGLPGGFLPIVWPGPRRKAGTFYRKAIREHQAGKEAAAMVQLGRVAHLLTDMACPVHVHRVIHETDPYEWYVEGNRARLAALPPSRVGDFSSPAAIIEALSTFTRGFAPDRTNNALGRLRKRFGGLRPLRRDEVAAQADRIIPEAAGYMAALFRLFLRDTGSIPAPG